MTMLIRIQCEKHDVRDREREGGGEKSDRESERERERVSWCFEPIIDKSTSKLEKRKPKTME